MKQLYIVLIFDKSDCFHFFVLSRLLKVVVCNDHESFLTVTIKRLNELVPVAIEYRGKIHMLGVGQKSGG
jgi:hypothetical protein